MENRYAEIARACGVVGAGGAGFPTHVKLDARVEYLVINGAECEPLMTVDQVLLLRYARELVRTADGLRAALGAVEARFGVKAKHAGAVDVLRRAAEGYSQVRVVELEDRYPAGDEYVLVYEAAGRQIPQGGIPLDCGVVVVNVETLWNLWRGEDGGVLTHKWVTVAGEVARPGTYRVPLGVTVGEMLDLAGGALIPQYRVLNGGPMMGRLVETQEEPVTKTTKGLLVLPEGSPAVLNRLRPIEHMLRLAQSVCCQCRMCTDLCPRNLLGYGIHPNKTILAAGYQWSVGAGAAEEALLCSECGACDMYACPMGLSPRRINGMLKGLLSRERVPAPDRGKQVQADPWRLYRRIPTQRLVRRLGLEGYHSPAEWIATDWSPRRVILPLRQHIGAPAEPIVGAGELVSAGQQIACIPEGALGSALFASITGTVTAVSGTAITIEATRGEA